MKLSKAIAGVAAIALSAALLPASALALQQGSIEEAGGSATVADSSLTEQAAAKKTMYVVKKIGDDKFTYNANGLVAKHVGSYETKKYRYSDAKVKSYSVTRNGSLAIEVTVKYDSKGRVKKVTSRGNSSYEKYSDTYSYNKKGQVSKIKRSYTTMSGGGTTTYKYTGKGYVASSLSTSGMKNTYGYDNHGNVSAFSSGPASGPGFTRYVENTYKYKNGYIVQRNQTMNGTGGAVYKTKYSYKKVSVPKKYVSQVKKQQRVLVGNANPAVVL